MAFEIERKFLVDKALLGELAGGVAIRQGYLPTAGETTVRVRLAGETACLTLKRPSTGATRLEFEYRIPLEDARQILAELCADSRIEKTRYRIPYGGRVWELDVFHGDNEGLIVAEVELQTEDEPISRPEWVTREVTHDPRYSNANLPTNPYRNWRNLVE